MRISVFDSLPDDAKKIREEVFMNEQGFKNEFDEIDNKAAHIVLYSDDNMPIATCRVFQSEESGTYTFGRLAVRKEYRGNSLGSLLIKEAEKYVAQKGGKELVLHAQCRVVDFYKKSGFTEFGEIGEDEGCPHIWMKKSV